MTALPSPSSWWLAGARGARASAASPARLATAIGAVTSPRSWRPASRSCVAARAGRGSHDERVVDLAAGGRSGAGLDWRARLGAAHALVLRWRLLSALGLRPRGSGLAVGGRERR